ncbi:MAG: hypothetical protein V4560_06055 [Bacteroidota bacterium]
MNKISILLVLLIFGLNVKAQETRYPYTIVNASCDCPEMEWTKEHSFELKDIHQSLNDIEIRLRTNEGFLYGIAYRILIRKNGIYHAFFYLKKSSSINPYIPDSLGGNAKFEKNPYIKFEITNKNLDSAFSILTAHHIGNLPNQSDIYKGPAFANHLMECKIGNKYAKYFFGGVKELMDSFPNENVYKDYYAILLALYGLSEPYEKQADEFIRYPERFRNK